MREQAVTFAVVTGFFAILFPFIVWGIRNSFRYFRRRDFPGLRRFLLFSWHLLIFGAILITLGYLASLNYI